MMTAAGLLNARNCPATGQQGKQRMKPYRRYSLPFCCITPADARTENCFFVLRTLPIPANFLKLRDLSLCGGFCYFPAFSTRSMPAKSFVSSIFLKPDFTAISATASDCPKPSSKNIQPPSFRYPAAFERISR